MASPTGPKIELHVHLEGTVGAATLLAMARRNGEALPADTVEGLAEFYRFSTFDHFLRTWVLTTHVMRTAEDFHQVVVDYAERAAAAGAVYIEGIFSPWFRVARGVSWDTIFNGYADGAADALERFGVQVALTPDIDRVLPPEPAEEVARQAVAFRDRGVLGLGLGGPEIGHPPEPFAPAFAIAADGGLAAVPHAGETAGAESIRGAVEALGARRIRHGVRILDDPGLAAEAVARGIVLDVCPVSNLRLGVVADLADHPLPALRTAGLACTVSTDDPAMFDTDLERDHAVAAALGVSARDTYAAGLAGALCDEATRARLAAIGAATDWDAVDRQAARAAAADALAAPVARRRAGLVSQDRAREALARAEEAGSENIGAPAAGKAAAEAAGEEGSRR